MGSGPNEGFKTLLDLCAKRGFEIERGNNTATIRNDDHVWTLELTASGMNRVTLINGEMDLPDDFEDRTGRGRNPWVAFGSGLIGHRGKNVLRDLAAIKLELRNHPKKQKRQAQAETAQADESITDVAPSTQEDSMSPALSPTQQAVEDILGMLPLVEESMYVYLLKEARRDDAPVQWINSKKYLDWTGNFFEYLRQEGNWPDIDTSVIDSDAKETEYDRAALARLTKELTDFCRRQGRMQCIHQFGDGEVVWRIRDDGRVFEEEMPVLPVSVNGQAKAPTPEPEAGKIEAFEQPSEAEVMTPEGKTLHYCEKCAFADYSRQARTMHTTQLRDADEHPTDVFPCPLCQAVRVTKVSLQAHMRKDHGSGNLCYACMDGSNASGQVKILWFGDPGAYNAHLDSVHASERRRRVRVEDAPFPATTKPGVQEVDHELDLLETSIQQLNGEPAQDSPSATQETEQAVPAPHAPATDLVAPEGIVGLVKAPVAPDEAAIQAAVSMVTRYPVLKAENETLKERLRDLAEQLVEQRDRANREQELREAAEAKLAAVVEAQEALNRALGR